MHVDRRLFLMTAGAAAAAPTLAGAAQTGQRAKAKAATYVLVHGGGHGGWCYQRVATLLRAAGHNVHAPTLTGLGERAHLVNPGIDLDTHITDVVNVLQYEDLSNVILVGHSYGGMVITGVADRALSRIGHLVFLDAAHPRNGQSLAAIAAVMQDARKQGRTVNGVEMVLWPDTDIIKNYGVTKAEDIAWMKGKLTPHPWKTFDTPLRLSNEAAVLKIPSTDITRPAPTANLPPDVATPSKRKEGAWEINTGHDMMVTAPQAVTEILLKIAATL